MLMREMLIREMSKHMLSNFLIAYNKVNKGSPFLPTSNHVKFICSPEESPPS